MCNDQPAGRSFNSCIVTSLSGTWEGASFYFKYGWHIWHAHNTERNNFVGDREGFTYDNPGKSMLAEVTVQPKGDVLELGLPYGCDPASPAVPPDGCVNWSGFTDAGNFSMGSVDGQQHVAILLNGTGAPQYRFILRMYTMPSTSFLARFPRNIGSLPPCTRRAMCPTR